MSIILFIDLLIYKILQYWQYFLPLSLFFSKTDLEKNINFLLYFGQSYCILIKICCLLIRTDRSITGMFLDVLNLVTYNSCMLVNLTDQLSSTKVNFVKCNIHDSKCDCLKFI